MHELDDNTLLRDYAEQNSETAFAALVTRHVDKVYSVALRHTRNAHAAEEITQAVFVILAKKSRRLGGKVILSGWLYETARLTAATYIRSEIRRAHREQEAHMQTALNENDSEVWPHIAPLLDDAMAKLSASDRHAIVLRYFDGKSLGEVGAAMGASEDAAKKRVTRAVEKLRGWFTKRGVTLTATVLTAAISANSVQAAPLGLAATVTAAAKGSAVGGSTLTLIKGALKTMAWTKMEMAVVVGAGVLLAAGTTAVTIKEIQKHRNSSWQTEQINPNIGNVLKSLPPLVEIVPSAFPNSKGWGYGSGGPFGQRIAGVSHTLKDLIYEANSTELPSDRLIFRADLPTNKFDYVVNLPVGSRQALRQKVAEQFGLVIKTEVLETNILLLRVASRDAQGLKSHQGKPSTSGWSMASSTFAWDNVSLKDFAKFLEMYLAFPVVDRTGLSNNFDINLKLKITEFPMDWNDHQLEDFQPALLNQLGLELVPTNLPIEMLVVEKVK